MKAKHFLFLFTLPLTLTSPLYSSEEQLPQESAQSEESKITQREHELPYDAEKERPISTPAYEIADKATYKINLMDLNRSHELEANLDVEITDITKDSMCVQAQIRDIQFTTLVKESDGEEVTFIKTTSPLEDQKEVFVTISPATFETEQAAVATNLFASDFITQEMTEKTPELVDFVEYLNKILEEKIFLTYKQYDDFYKNSKLMQLGNQLFFVDKRDNSQETLTQSVTSPLAIRYSYQNRFGYIVQIDCTSFSSSKQEEYQAETALEETSVEEASREETPVEEASREETPVEETSQETEEAEDLTTVEHEETDFDLL